MILVHRDVVRLISVVYFFQGATGIAAVALPLYLRGSGMSIKEIAYYNSVVAIPWFFKIIYGIVSDAVPIGGFRRKPYIMICAALASLGWFLMAVFPPQMVFLIAAMATANFGFAVIDVVTDGIVVEHSTENTTQIYQGISWGARSVGAIASGFLGGYMAANLNYRLVFALTAFLPLASVAVAYSYRERAVRQGRKIQLGRLLSNCFKNLMSGDLRWFCLLLLIVSLSSSFSTPLFFRMREELQFHEKFLGLLSSVSWIGAIAGCFLYLKFFKHMRLKRALYLAVTIGFLAILSCLLIQNQKTAFLVFLAAGILGYLTLLPLMSSAARLAHGTGVESSLFAILMSIFNMGQSGATFAGGWFAEEMGIDLLIVLTAFATLSGIFVIRRLKSL